MLLALRGLPSQFNPPDRPIVSETVRTLMSALWQQNEVGGLLGHIDAIRSTEYDGARARLLTASADGTARIWNMDGRQQSTSLIGHTDKVLRARFSPDGALVVTASSDGTARVWNARTGAAIHILSGHAAEVVYAAFNADGSKIVTASFDRTARVWDTTTGSLLLVLEGHLGGLASAEFSPIDDLILTTAADNSARLWDGISGEEVSRLGDIMDEEEGAGTPKALFSPDGLEIGFCDGYKASLRETKDLMFAHDFDLPNSCSAIQFDTREKWIAIGLFSGQIEIYGLDDYELQGTLRGHEENITSITVVSDGLLLLSTSADGSARLWSLIGFNEMARLGSDRGSLSVAAADKWGKLIVTGHEDGDIRLWAQERLSAPVDVLHLSSSLQPVNDLPDILAFSTVGGTALISKEDGIWLYRFSDGRSLTLNAAIRDKDSEVYGTLSKRGDKALIYSSNGVVILWYLESGQEEILRGEGTAVHAAAFSPSGDSVALALADGTVRVLDTTKGSELWNLSGHEGAVSCVSYSGDGRRLVSGSEDKTILIWDIGTGANVARMGGHVGLVVAVALDNNGELAATTDGAGLVRIWNVETGALLHSLSGYIDVVWNVEFSPDGHSMLTTTLGEPARLWRVESGEKVIDVDADLSTAFSGDGSELQYLSRTGMLQRFYIGHSLSDLVMTACARLPRDLTETEKIEYIGTAEGKWACQGTLGRIGAGVGQDTDAGLGN